MARKIVVESLRGPVRHDVRVPGSKSITNRALAIASLAEGQSVIHGVLHANDTEAMIKCLRILGAEITIDGTTATVNGVGGRWKPASEVLHVHQAATVARFLLPSLLLGQGTYVLDGDDQIKRRPMGPLVKALRRLGLQIEGDELPLTITAPAEPLIGPFATDVAADTSSQFLSGLLLAGPYLHQGLTVDLSGTRVSAPYIHMTMEVMRQFSAEPIEVDGCFRVPTTGYRGTEYEVEPDASAASYFFAAAAISQGSVRIHGLPRHPLQGDIRFVGVLEKMGATVRWEDDYIEVSSDGPLHGIDAGINMADFSDTAQTLAVVAAFAEGRTHIHGIGFIRHKETDRVRHVVRELQHCGVSAWVDENEDGFVVDPVNPPRGAEVTTYGDHRMAMSFALIGLRVPGVSLDDRDCVNKTFPGFWDELSRLHEAPSW